MSTKEYFDEDNCHFDYGELEWVRNIGREDRKYRLRLLVLEILKLYSLYNKYAPPEENIASNGNINTIYSDAVDTTLSLSIEEEIYVKKCVKEFINSDIDPDRIFLINE